MKWDPNRTTSVIKENDTVLIFDAQTYHYILLRAFGIQENSVKSQKILELFWHIIWVLLYCMKQPNFIISSPYSTINFSWIEKNYSLTFHFSLSTDFADLIRAFSLENIFEFN